MVRRSNDRTAYIFEGSLAQAIWAQQLTPEQMARVEADTFETFVPKGGYVCRKGDMVENWLGIIDGMVKMTNFSANGKSVTFTGAARWLVWRRLVVKTRNAQIRCHGVAR
jgi:CRP-like cAMP-binding protein